MSKKLREIISGTSILQVCGNIDVLISSVEFDSRKVKQGTLFVAVNGVNVNGHRFITSAIEAGAVAVVCDVLPDELVEGVVYLRVGNTGQCLGLLVSEFFDHPSRKLKLIGVTGTNGKTTIATLLYHAFQKLGYKTGLLSTVRYLVNKKEIESSHTTPDAITINRLLAEMVREGCDFCFMEVSSHAIHQDRISGLEFNGGVFTNLTHDHLDYHVTFREYLNAKKRFFDHLPANAFALTNVDDKNGLVMLQNTKSKKVTYSTRSMADFRCKVLESHLDGMLLKVDGYEIWTHFVGNFNAHNLLAVYSTAVLLGQDKEEALQVISDLRSVDGRFETIRSSNGIIAVVDYAHTPDAVKNVLGSIDEIRTRNEQVITVIGAGGDRDKTKRPKMAAEAITMSDRVILTSDNPRSEDPSTIIEDMKPGIPEHKKNRVLAIIDRKEAIRTAVMLAQPGDIIVIAGKGHEDYQEIKGVKYHFDDREVILEIFKENN